jgi:2-oxoisovalerate dehydrogenase E1 component
MRGFKPIPEIQFSDYIYPAMEQIRNNLSNLRWRSNNQWWAPVVIRATSGGYLAGSGALCHSQSVEATFAHFPGMYILMPSTVSDAVGLMKTAVRHCNDPVLFLEEKILYRPPELEEPYPGKDYTIPFGKARIDLQADYSKRGPKVTVVTYGTTRLMASKVVSEHFQGKVEVIDLRTLVPWDKETVFESVKKTGRVLALHGANRTAGFGAELMAEVAEKCFDYLDVPVRRLAALDLPVPYGYDNEYWVLPQKEDLAEAIEELLSA